MSAKIKEYIPGAKNPAWSEEAIGLFFKGTDIHRQMLGKMEPTSLLIQKELFELTKNDPAKVWDVLFMLPFGSFQCGGKEYPLSFKIKNGETKIEMEIGKISGGVF